MGKKIVIAGNPVDGLQFFGPFEDNESAQVFADSLTTNEWWVADLLEK